VDRGFIALKLDQYRCGNWSASRENLEGLNRCDHRDKPRIFGTPSKEREQISIGANGARWRRWQNGHSGRHIQPRKNHRPARSFRTNGSNFSEYRRTPGNYESQRRIAEKLGHNSDGYVAIEVPHPDYHRIASVCAATNRSYIDLADACTHHVGEQRFDIVHLTNYEEVRRQQVFLRHAANAGHNNLTAVTLDLLAAQGH
jgi:hypothetical protein